jgi:hypothetical protein
MYWTVRDKVASLAQNLIDLRSGKKIAIQNADQFFLSLRDSVLALDRLHADDPISQKVAVARTKKYLSSSAHLIDFHDLLHRETGRVIEIVNGPQFSMQDLGEAAGLLADRLTSYERVCSTLLSISATSAYWSGPEHQDYLLKALQRLLEDPQPPRGRQDLLKLRRYPGLLFLYVTCISALAGDRYAFLAAAFRGPIRLAPHEKKDHLVALVHQYEVLNHSDQKQLPGRERQYTPLSNHLYEQLKPFLREILPSDSDYEHTFDWFEYLLGLMYCYYTHDWDEYGRAKAEGHPERVRIWGPLGCFAWRHRLDPESVLYEARVVDGVLPNNIAKVRQAFLPGNNPGALQRFLLAKEAFDRFVESAAGSWH